MAKAVFFPEDRKERRCLRHEGRGNARQKGSAVTGVLVFSGSQHQIDVDSPGTAAHCRPQKTSAIARSGQLSALQREGVASQIDL